MKWRYPVLVLAGLATVTWRTRHDPFPRPGDNSGLDLIAFQDPSVHTLSRVRGYDLETGNVIWEGGGLANNIVASPVAGDGMAFVGSSYEKRVLLAIRLDSARGDITGTDWVPWTRRRTTPYVPSPLLYDGVLYCLAHYQSVLTRVDARTGPMRLRGIGNVYASPVAAARRVYVTDLNGATLVLSHEETPRALAINRLEDRFNASAALAGHQIYLRGEKHLYAIGPANTAPP